MPGLARDVAVQGDFAYVPDEDGLRVVDVSDPPNPTEVVYHDTPGSAHGVYVSGSTAYVVANSGSQRGGEVSEERK